MTAQGYVLFNINPASVVSILPKAFIGCVRVNVEYGLPETFGVALIPLLVVNGKYAQAFVIGQVTEDDAMGNDAGHPIQPQPPSSRMTAMSRENYSILGYMERFSDSLLLDRLIEFVVILVGVWREGVIEEPVLARRAHFM
jgi:hypothetical protein